MKNVWLLARAALSAIALIGLLATPALSADTPGQTLAGLEQVEFGPLAGATPAQQAASYDAELQFIVRSTWDGRSAAHVEQSIAAARQRLAAGGLDTTACNRAGCDYANLLGHAYAASLACATRGDMPYTLSFQAALDSEVSYLLRAHGNPYASTWT